MYKILFLCVALLFFGTQAHAGFVGPGASSGVTSVAQALKAADDSRCVLTGHIVKKMPTDDDDYVFQDATGEIVVEIDEKYFYGRVVTPSTKVRLYGEVDREPIGANEIDVKQMEILE